jgi:hypothetical protein
MRIYCSDIDSLTHIDIAKDFLLIVFCIAKVFCLIFVADRLWPTDCVVIPSSCFALHRYESLDSHKRAV